MTREEAIDRLKGLYGNGYNEQEEALEMAIQALEQEPKCRDCVSRDYLLSIANKDGAYGYVSAHEIINAPSVNPQPKTGHWIDTDEWRETVDGFEQWGYFRKCSKCGYVFKFLEIDNYCPNCGAKMDESEDE